MEENRLKFYVSLGLPIPLTDNVLNMLRDFRYITTQKVYLKERGYNIVDLVVLIKDINFRVDGGLIRDLRGGEMFIICNDEENMVREAILLDYDGLSKYIGTVA